MAKFEIIAVYTVGLANRIPSFQTYFIFILKGNFQHLTGGLCHIHSHITCHMVLSSIFDVYAEF